MFIKNSPETSSFLGTVSLIKKYNTIATMVTTDQEIIITHEEDTKFNRRIQLFKWVTDHMEPLTSAEKQLFIVEMYNDHTRVINKTENTYDKIVINLSL